MKNTKKLIGTLIVILLTFTMSCKDEFLIEVPLSDLSRRVPLLMLPAYKLPLNRLCLEFLTNGTGKAEICSLIIT